jgi:hypothetical protein
MNVAMNFDLEFFDDTSHALATANTGCDNTVSLI